MALKASEVILKESLQQKVALEKRDCIYTPVNMCGDIITES